MLTRIWVGDGLVGRWCAVALLCRALCSAAAARGVDVAHLLQDGLALGPPWEMLADPARELDLQGAMRAAWQPSQAHGDAVSITARRRG